MNWFLIPLFNYPVTFQIQLAGVNYEMTVKWNNAADAGWVFDLTNADTATQLLAGAPFVTGTDCLAGLEYLGIQGSLIVFTKGDNTAVPTMQNLGQNSNLYFVTTAVTN